MDIQLQVRTAAIEFVGSSELTSVRRVFITGERMLAKA